jgi:HEPN domain-containing protein
MSQKQLNLLVDTVSSFRGKVMNNIPLEDYKALEYLRTQKIPKGIRVYVLEALPLFSPLDIDVGSLVEKHGWFRADRFRFWYPLKMKPLVDLPEKLVPIRFYIRRFDVINGRLVVCRVFPAYLQILSDDEEYAESFFSQVFCNVPPTFHSLSDWAFKKDWSSKKRDVLYFMSALGASLSWSESIDNATKEVRDSYKEAQKAFEAGLWKSTVVMCRRATEAVLKEARIKFFRKMAMKKGRKLALYELIKVFESIEPSIIPLHYLRLLDAIRLIGNIPGAHPEKPIPNYKFTYRDASLALSNLGAFLNMYYETL